jgi:hypothetical protein
MIVLRFGTSGRLAGLCRAATQLIHPDYPVVVFGRDVGFRTEGAEQVYDTLEGLIRAYPQEEFIVLDASVDHGSTESLVAHEGFKRGCLATLAERGLIRRCVGFSSGIALIDVAQVRASAKHMVEYRRQKLLQESLFTALDCPVFLPQLFTLLGPRTYASQNAAWAQVLRARLERVGGVVLHEPHARKAWVSEFEVFRRLLEFLAADCPESVIGPLVQGDFTLHEIARGEKLPLPPIVYEVGADKGWLRGDYSLPAPMPYKAEMTNELVRVIAML